MANVHTMRLDDRRLRAAETVFREVVDLPREQRRAAVLERCGSDVELRALVERILEGDAGSSAGDGFQLRVGGPAVGPAHRIGHYQLVREIGRGGVGVVYEARQDHPKRSVALKLLRFAEVRADVLRRFQLEAEVLGQLNHPGIAHIYEAGVAEIATGLGPQSVPFVAMELINGAPLTRYAQSARLTPEDRLELLALVADAVHHAHQKGVIHRDLKPANILVTPEGRPRVLDFGVARVATVHTSDVEGTSAGQLIGTPAYMSPEQAAGRITEVDIRSDIYSLGVVGFELLAGVFPYDLAGLSLSEVVHAIQHAPPRRLGSICPSQRGDVEIVIARALEKDRERRYPSAAEFAADLRRCVRHEPIAARPPSFAYQLAKFARRRRGLVAAICVIAIAILGGSLAAGVQAIRAMRAERIAQAVNTFLNRDLLGQANPYNQPDRDIRLRTILDRASERIKARFADEPRVEAAIRETLGTAYMNLDDLGAAEAHLTRALALMRSEYGESDRQSIRVALSLGETLRKAVRLDEADALLRATERSAAEAFGGRDPDTLMARNNLAALALSRRAPAEAEQIAREVLAIRREVLGSDHGATLVSMNTLGSALERLGRFDEAEALYSECVERSRRSIGNEHPDTMTAINNLGLFYSRLERFAQAEPLCLESLALRERVLGPDHDATLASRNNVGFLYSLQDRYTECEPYYRETYEIRRSKLGVEHPDTLLSMNNLGWLYSRLERWDDSEALLTELVEVGRRVEPDSSDLYLSIHSLGGLLVARGEPRRAEPLLREAIEGLQRRMPAGEWRIGAAKVSLGSALRRQERYEEAEGLLLEGHDRVARVLGPAHRQTQKGAEELVALYESWGRSEQADAWRAKLAP